MEVLHGHALHSNTSVKKGIYALVAIPLLLFCVLRLFENRLTILVMSILAPEPDKGFVFYQDFVQLCSTELLWFSFLGLLTALFSTRGTSAIRSVIGQPLPTGLTLFITPVFLAVTFLVVYFVLEDFPNSSDEYTYLFQAETLANGQLWQEPPPFEECSHYNHIVQRGEVRAGRFPPGWPMILSAAFFLDIPTWLVNPLLGAACLVLVYVFARRFYGATVATWSLIATAFTSFFIFNSASYFSHVACLAATLLYVLCMHLSFTKDKPTLLIIAGFCLGWVILIRYFTAALIFIPFFAYMVQRYRSRVLKPLLLIAIGTIPCLVVLGWYNFEITGNPFLPVTVWGDDQEGLGFVKDHTFMAGAEHVVRWMFMFAYWCSPGLLILYLIYLWKKVRGPAVFEHPEDYFFAVLMAGYFFYYQIGGNQYGPRFMFESLPFLVIFVVRNILKSKREWVRAVLIASVLFAITKIPFIAVREATVIDQRQDVYDLVSAHGIRNAVILIASHTSPVRPMPVGDLTRNSSTFDDEVLYFHDCEGDLDELLKYYNDRQFFRYTRELNNPNGKLVRIR